jgi:ADP-L-glycero-D-manno-heptose 6-epimerase
MAEEMLNAKWEANKNGLYNLGTGKARTFNELLTAVFNSMQLPVHIEYIDTPADIRDKYQYFTEANMRKLQIAGYSDSFYSVEAGVHDYVSNYLSTKKYF